jgi:hypothetical protein
VIKAGLFCGSRVFSWTSWKVEGFKLRAGSIRYRVRGREKGFLLGVGPFIFWSDCKHERLRCVHAAEFNSTERRRRGMPGTEVARVACVDCNVLIYGVPRLRVCSDTGYTHSLTRM